jgi:uncharacterized lipoprotein NlpE involved in copper resistance
MLNHFSSIILLTLSLFCFTGCGQQNDRGEVTDMSDFYDEHNARNSLDWFGVYEGVVPCADCEGIYTRVELDKAGTYRRIVHYLGKEDLNIYESDGSFLWNEEGNTITLEGAEGANMYFVAENRLIQLDLQGMKITGELAELYELKKQ